MYELDVKVSSYLEYIFQFEVPIDLILVLDTRRFGFQDVRSYICANRIFDFKKIRNVEFNSGRHHEKPYI